MISLDDFSELLRVLYATPLEPSRWEDFLTRLAKLTGSSGAYLLVADRLQGLSIRMQGGGLSLSDQALATYAAIAPEDPYRYLLVKQGRLGVLDSDLLVPEEQLVETSMYKLLLEPLGVRHPTTLMLNCTLQRMEVISVWRSREQGRLPEEHMRLLELVVPHVQAVLDIRRKLGAIHSRLHGVEAMADASPSPTLLVSGKGRLLHANRGARNLLDEADGLIVENGKLKAANDEGNIALQELIQHARAGADIYLAGSRAILLARTTSRKSLQITASPVPPAPSGSPATVLLVVHDPERPLLVPEDVMGELFNMTGAEVEVASGLLTGYSLPEIAALRSVSLGTVRMQLKSIFTKTGTHKQADLVRVLMSMPGVA